MMWRPGPWWARPPAWRSWCRRRAARWWVCLLPPGAEPAVPLQVGDRVRVILTEPAYACAAGESGTIDTPDGTTPRRSAPSTW